MCSISLIPGILGHAQREEKGRSAIFFGNLMWKAMYWEGKERERENGSEPNTSQKENWDETL